MTGPAAAILATADPAGVAPAMVVLAAQGAAPAAELAPVAVLEVALDASDGSAMRAPPGARSYDRCRLIRMLWDEVTEGQEVRLHST